jgi:hypothetical protein
MKLEVDKLSKERKLLISTIQELEKQLQAVKVSVVYIHHNLQYNLVLLFVTYCMEHVNENCKLLVLLR